MTPLLPGLLADILANPDEDGYRLAASDWWEEHGETERAEFVRVQCTLAALKSHTHHISEGQPARVVRACEICRNREALRRRERELRGWWGNWTPRVVGCAWSLDGNTGMVSTIDESRPGRSAMFTFTFCRGFVHSLTCTAVDWLAHADAITAQQPVRAVELTTWGDDKEIAEANIRILEKAARMKAADPENWWEWAKKDGPWFELLWPDIEFIRSMPGFAAVSAKQKA